MSFDPSHPAPVDERTHPTPDLYGINPFVVMVATHAATQQQLDTTERLLEYLGALETPAQMETIVMTPTAPTQESRERVERPCLSIGLLNPTALNIYFSPVGTAGKTQRSLSVPPNCFMVVPISAAMIEVAADATDLGANTAVVFLFRFFTVQAAYLGKGA